MKRHIILIMTTILFAGFSSLRAQQGVYQSELLAKLGKNIGYKPDSTLSAGTYNAGTVIGLPVIAEYNSRHTITHLGFHLFSEDMKEAYASDVYNFLERYFLEMYCWEDKTTLNQKLHDDKVIFTQGSFADVKMINENTQFSINRVENKYYQVTWSDRGKTIIDIAFPIQYELILGMPQIEIEKSMFDMIVSASHSDNTMKPDSFELVKDNIYRTIPAQYYQSESLNNSVYYYGKGDTLVLDTLNCDLSAINIFHIATNCNNPMTVEQTLYGFNKSQYTITLRQWLNYCESVGLTIYAAVEEEYSDGFKMLIVAENKDLGYNHLLSVVVPKNFVYKGSAQFSIKMNAFIPTHNVKNLYQQFKKSTKKKIY